jgi:hypothetical protein
MSAYAGLSPTRLASSVRKTSPLCVQIRVLIYVNIEQLLPVRDKSARENADRIAWQCK